MVRGMPAYALGGLIILVGTVLSISLILSIPSPITTITGYLNITANAYLGVGENLLVIVGQNNFNLPITNLNIYIPRAGTNITITTEIPSGSYFLVMVYQGPSGSTIIAPGLGASGSPGDLANLTKSNYTYGLNATAIINNEASRRATFQISTQDSSIISAIPYIANLSKPLISMYIFQMIPMGTVNISRLNIAAITQQGLQEVTCNLSTPIIVSPGNPTYMAINISAMNGTIKPLNTWYSCNATPATALPTLLYLEVALRYVYNYEDVTVVREDWFPVLIAPMQSGNT
ncbi:MAG: hypothetical protein RXN86_00115 [Vulcanisaeta sp.]